MQAFQQTGLYHSEDNGLTKRMPRFSDIAIRSNENSLKNLKMEFFQLLMHRDYFESVHKSLIQFSALMA